MKYTLSQSFTFEAAHTLKRSVPVDEYTASARVHGHSYRATVAVTGQVGAAGMLQVREPGKKIKFRNIDLFYLREAIEKVRVMLDHRMLDDIDAQKSSAKWTKDAGEFIPNPSTWLNQGRWMDGADGDGGGEITHWHETRGGVDARATALGMLPWNGIEQWVFFRARVIEASKEAA